MKWVETGGQVQSLQIMAPLVSRDQVRCGFLTCNDFFSFFPPISIDPSFVALLYILIRRAESHTLAFMCMWHYQNAQMTVHQLWLLTKWHRKTFCTSSLSDMTFSQDFRMCPTPLCCLSPPHPTYLLHLQLNPSGYTLGCLTSDFLIYCSLTGPWILIQSETHIVIKSIKFPSL